MIRRRHKDPVTPALHDAVIARDVLFAGGCVAAFLDPLHRCLTVWGEPQKPDRWLTLDHVQDSGGRMGRRAPSDRDHLVSLCAHAHFGGWATSHRPLLREYLDRANREADTCPHVDRNPSCVVCARRSDPLTLSEAAG